VRAEIQQGWAPIAAGLLILAGPNRDVLQHWVASARGGPKKRGAASVAGRRELSWRFKVRKPASDPCAKPCSRRAAP
jgi:hypothetical protein